MADFCMRLGETCGSGSLERRSPSASTQRPSLDTAAVCSSLIPGQRCPSSQPALNQHRGRGVAHAFTHPEPTHPSVGADTRVHGTALTAPEAEFPWVPWKPDVGHVRGVPGSTQGREGSFSLVSKSFSSGYVTNGTPLRVWAEAGRQRPPHWPPHLPHIPQPGTVCWEHCRRPWLGAGP